MISSYFETNICLSNRDYTWQQSTSGSQEYSAVDAYVQQPESHEQTALGYGTRKPEEAVAKRTKKAKKHIKETGKKLPK